MLRSDNSNNRCPLKPGQMVAGRYRVLAFLGAGSTGWVLKVSDRLLGGETVALKVIFPHLVRDRTSVERLRREVVLARQLAHPLIVHVHDFEEHANGETYLAMEYVCGLDLGAILAERKSLPLPFDEVLLILARVGEALLHAHQQGIVHRDLKPSNILIGADGRVRLCDFGLAKSFEMEFGLTRTGESPGTPEYMAPEQFRAEASDQRTDVYAFGILAYELITGAPPFRDENYFRLGEYHLHEALPRLRSDSAASSDERVPEWLEQIVQACCQKSPADRPTSLAEILPVLQRAIPQDTMLRTSREPLNKRLRAGRRLKQILSGALVAGAVLGIFEWIYAQNDVRIAVMSNVLFAEARLGMELVPLRRFLGIHASVFRPSTAFDVVEAEDKYQVGALMEADELLISRGEIEPMKSVANAKDAAGYTVVDRIVRKDQSDLAEHLDRIWIDTQHQDPEGETVLTYAIKNHKLGALEGLYAVKDLAVNVANRDGQTPLHLAVTTADLFAVGMLTKRFGANIGIRNKEGLTALHLAVQLGNVGALEQLRQASEDPNVRDANGQTALMHATRLAGPSNERVTVAGLVVDLDPNISAVINARDNRGRTALMHAADNGREDLIDFLLHRKADRTSRDNDGRTAYDYALSKRMSDRVLDLLRLPEPAAIGGASP